MPTFAEGREPTQAGLRVEALLFVAPVLLSQGFSLRTEDDFRSKYVCLVRHGLLHASSQSFPSPPCQSL